MRNRQKRRKQPTKKISDGRKHELGGIAFVTAAVISLGGLLGENVGFVGLYFAQFLRYFFGVGSWLAALFLLWLGLRLILKHQGLKVPAVTIGTAGLFAALLALYHHFAIPIGGEILLDRLPAGGGLLGGGLLFLIRKFFGVTGGVILLGAGAVASLILVTSWSLASGVNKTGAKAKEKIASAREKAQQMYQQAMPLGKSSPELMYDQERDTHFREAAALTSSAPATPTESSVQATQTDSRMMGQKNENDEERRLATAALWTEIRKKTDDEEKESSPLNEGTAIAAQNSSAATISPERMDLEPVWSPENSDDLAAALTFPNDSFGDAEISSSSDETPAVSDRAMSAPVTESEKSGAKGTIGQGTRELPPAASSSPEGEAPTYVVPKVADILQHRNRVPNTKLEQEIAENSRILTQTLENFNVKASIVNACHGPAVTRYEVEPAPGVKVSKITNLADDLALALAAFSVRIEPVPGKSVIGIEVPNKKLESVQLRDVLETAAFTTAPSKLTVGLGMDIGGQTILADLAKMPHLLVAGATGSGKSVCINTLITSILFKAAPDEVKFILIDPKMVELSGYNDIPHLMAPVVTDAQKAASVLNWSVREMENRYAKFAAASVRDLRHYNQTVPPEEKMPAVVIIIDELADLMMVASRDVEDAICRLAQKARAAGIHLVLATQRPSVNVITGLIKANIPSRISFAVSSLTDSRTILDRGGAEKLLGNGDMLFSPVGAAKPLRVQGAFISDEEIERLLDYIRAQGQQTVPNEDLIDFTENASTEPETSDTSAVSVDELLEPAVEFIFNAGQASASSIQRRFRIGYTRAARLIDTMEEVKIIGPNMGSKPREILMTKEEASIIISSLKSGK